MRGASAIQEVLREFQADGLTAFVIWEPILPTDFSAPGRSALSRVADKRAAQFWDPQHLFALELQKKLRADAGHPQPTCCDAEEAIPWDMILVYPPGSRWDADLPRASYADGPVWKLKPGLRQALRDASKPGPASP